MEHYLSEIVRVMRPGGRCLMTYFLLNEESESLMRAGASTLPFEFGGDGCRIANRQLPEAVVAYEEAAIRSLFQRYGLHIDEPIRYGSWCGREVYLSYQDIVLAGKRC